MRRGFEKWVEIDLDKIAHNVREIKSHLKPGTVFMAVVKADAYGHGMDEVSRVALRNGADWLCVSSAWEGEQLRKQGRHVPILVLSPPSRESAGVAVRNGLIQSVESMEQFERLRRVSEAEGRKSLVQIKVDTGLGRFGVLPEGVVDLAKKVRGTRSLFLQGIYTHFASPYNDPRYTRLQYKRFMEIRRRVRGEAIPVKMFHCANSPAAMDFPFMHLDAVRLGSSLYFRCKGTVKANQWDLVDCLEFKTRILSTKQIPPHWHVGYKNRFIAQRRMKIGLIPVGHTDGLPTQLANRGHVLVRGKKVPLVGSVCFSHSFVDLTDFKEGGLVGEEVVLFGKQGGENISYRDIAGQVGAGTSETVLRITRAVPRVYLGTG